MQTRLFAATFVLKTDSLGVRLAVLGIIASFAVAGATLWMAKKTKDLAVDAAAELETGRRQAAAASTRPWIVPNDLSAVEIRSIPRDTVNSVFVEARLKNVGPGLALIKSADSWICGYGHLNDSNTINQYSNVFTETPIVPSGDEFVMSGTVRHSSANWSGATPESIGFQKTPDGGYPQTGEYVVEVAYTDAAGEDEVVAKVRVIIEKLHTDSGGWTTYSSRVHRVDYFRGEDQDPFLSTKIGSPG